MKHLRSIFLCSLLLAAMQMQAQTPTVKWGNLYKDTDWEYVIHNGVIYTHENSISKSGTFIEKIDNNTNSVALHKPYNYTQDRKPGVLPYRSSLLSTSGGLFLLRRLWLTKGNSVEYSLLPVDTTTLSIGEKICVTTMKGPIGIDGDIQSPNGSLICFFSTTSNSPRSTITKALNITVIDAVKQKVLWEKVIPLEDSEGTYSFSQGLLTNSGNFLCFLQFRKGNDLSYRLLHVSSSAVNVNKKVIEDGKLLTNVLIRENKAGEIFAIGTYRNAGDEDYWSCGVYSMKIESESGKLLQSNTYSFSEQTYAATEDAKLKKVAHLEPEDIVELANGNTVVLFQKKVYMSGSTTLVPGAGPVSTYATVTPDFKLLLSLNSSGTKTYETVIPCKGYTQQNDIAIYENKNNELALFYRSYVTTGKEKSVRFTCAKVDEQGKHSVSSLVDESSADVLAMSVSKLSEDKFLVFRFSETKRQGGYGMLFLK